MLVIVKYTYYKYVVYAKLKLYGMKIIYPEAAVKQPLATRNNCPICCFGVYRI